MNQRPPYMTPPFLAGMLDALKEAGLPPIKPPLASLKMTPRQPAGTGAAGAFRNKSGPVASPSPTPKSVAPGPISNIDARVPGT